MASNQYEAWKQELAGAEATSQRQTVEIAPELRRSVKVRPAR
jgi:hypothetical protein